MYLITYMYDAKRFRVKADQLNLCSSESNRHSMLLICAIGDENVPLSIPTDDVNWMKEVEKIMMEMFRLA